jgi:hypothetical protein
MDIPRWGIFGEDVMIKLPAHVATDPPDGLAREAGSGLYVEYLTPRRIDETPPFLGASNVDAYSVRRNVRASVTFTRPWAVRSSDGR